MNYLHVPGVKYIAGVTFQSEYGTHEAGTEVKEAEKFPNLVTLVDAHFLYPYAPDGGYDFLPPHLFNDVRTRQELLDHLAGDPINKQVTEQFPGQEKPAVIKLAEREAEAQDEIYTNLKAASQPGRPAPEGPTPEEVAAEATGTAPKKAAAKKTAARTTTKEKK